VGQGQHDTWRHGEAIPAKLRSNKSVASRGVCPSAKSLRVEICQRLTIASEASRSTLEPVKNVVAPFQSSTACLFNHEPRPSNNLESLDFARSSKANHHFRSVSNSSGGQLAPSAWHNRNIWSLLKPPSDKSTERKSANGDIAVATSRLHRVFFTFFIDRDVIPPCHSSAFLAKETEP
jgi:hypothetical protein